MEQTTKLNHPAAVAAAQSYLTGFVKLKDSTRIGYRQIGAGPAVIMVHGAMESAQSHMQLAEALADSFTVYLIDRRGRGLSGPYGADYSVQEDVEDMEALLNQTGAHFVFGVSAGADIWLQAALSLPGIQKMALYEPALFVDHPAPLDLIGRYDQEMAKGRQAAALVTAMKATQMGPAVFNRIPRWLLERMTHGAMANEDKKAGPEDVTMRKLAPTLHYDFELVARMSEKKPETFQSVRADVLLLGGSDSPSYLKTALNALEKVLPRVQRIEFPGLNHGGSGNASNYGQPERVAAELRKFFA